MAFSRLYLPVLWLLLSLFVIAFADEYNYGDNSSKYRSPSNYPEAKPKGEANPTYDEQPRVYKTELEVEAEHGYVPKPNGEEKSSYGAKPDTYKPKPEGEEKSSYDTKSDTYKPKPEGEEKPNYDTKPDTYKQKPEGEEKPNYDTYKPKREEEAKPTYGEKPKVYKTELEVEAEHGYGSKSEEEEKKPNYDTKYNPYNSKRKEEAKSTYGEKPKEEEKLNYDTKPKASKPKTEGNEKSYYGTKPEVNEKPLPTGVQGLVLCKSGSKYYPIQGALAKVECVAVDEVGVEKTLSICSLATDTKGYFFKTFPGLKLKNCKAFLEKSPLESCKVPTDVNKGITGAPLSTYRVLNQKHAKLYSVGPFFFTSEAKPVSNGY